MLLQQQPVPGNWYAGGAGQLIYVRAVLYTAGQVTLVAFEHANGKQVLLNWKDWNRLRLTLHTQRPERRGRAGDL